VKARTSAKALERFKILVVFLLLGLLIMGQEWLGANRVPSMELETAEFLAAQCLYGQV